MTGRWAGAMLPAVLAAGVAMAGPPSPPIYAVGRIGSAIDDGQLVGSRRAGLACLPNGSIRWGDLADGTTMDRRETVQDALEDAGVALTPLGTEAAPGRPVAVLRATIREAALDLCARGWALGGRGRLSGHARFVVDWRLEARDGTVASHVSRLDETLDGAHATTLGAIRRLMLVDAAKDAAAWLLARP